MSSSHLQPGDVKFLSNNLAILGCYNEEDGSGYLHCLLESFHPTYSRMRNGNYRIYLAKSLRLGAIPEIIKTNYRVEDLFYYYSDKTSGKRIFSIDDPYAVYQNASQYGVTLKPELLKLYAQFLRVSYRLFNVDLDLVEEYIDEDTQCPPTNIIKFSDEEYHLLIKPRGLRENSTKLRYSVLDTVVF